VGDHPRGRVAVWILVAVAGLAIAVVLSVAASNLSTQPIGLSAEPLRAGERLAPADVTRQDAQSKPKSKPAKQRATTHTATTPSVTSLPQATGETGDDHGGRHTDSDDD
jgi:hypothetical protein